MIISNIIIKTRLNLLKSTLKFHFLEYYQTSLLHNWFGEIELIKNINSVTYNFVYFITIKWENFKCL